MLDGKKIIVGVSGGIAAYKTAGLVSALKQAGAEVHVLMTEHAERFVGAITFEALSGHRVIQDTFESEEYIIPHIELARTADLFVVAPATANVIAKLAHGIADDMLGSTFLACTCPKLVVPAMNVHMYENSATQANLEILRARGIELLDPDTGHLAEGESAKGKMPEASVIYRVIEQMISYGHDLVGKKIVVTAGATREALDPVRFLTNKSTGKMGYALAKAAACRGAEVVLISGQVHRYSDGIETGVLAGGKAGDLLAESSVGKAAGRPAKSGRSAKVEQALLGVNDGVLLPAGVRLVPVVSAEDMFQAVKREYKDADCIIMAAAVADFRPMHPAESKLKKTQLSAEADGSYTIQLERTTDILSWLGEHKKKGQKLIGFSMETDNLLENSEKKLDAKHADMIVANSLRTAGAGFGTDTNVVTLIKQDELLELPLMGKEAVAVSILDEIFD